MSMPVNTKTFNEMVDEDVEIIKENMDESIYRSHIIECLEMAKKYYKEVYLANLPDSAWDC